MESGGKRFRRLQTVDKPLCCLEKPRMGGCEGGREAPCTFNQLEAVDFVDSLKAAEKDSAA